MMNSEESERGPSNAPGLLGVEVVLIVLICLAAYTLGNIAGYYSRFDSFRMLLAADAILLAAVIAYINNRGRIYGYKPRG